jgi:hypothetical protein
MPSPRFASVLEGVGFAIVVVIKTAAARETGEIILMSIKRLRELDISGRSGQYNLEIHKVLLGDSYIDHEYR